MNKYVKKPVVVEAIQWDGENLVAVLWFMGQEVNLNCPAAHDAFEHYRNIVDRDGLIIKNLEGQHIASIGDFIIKGVKGEFYPCKSDIFEQTYEKV